MCHKCPKRSSKTRTPEFLERRPSEDLRSSLPLSALPVLARKGFLEALGAVFARGNEVKSLLGGLGAVLLDLGSLLGRLGSLLGGLE